MSRTMQGLFTMLLVSALAVAGICGWAAPSADADEISDLQAQIERSAADYDTASARVSELEESINETNAHIEELEQKLPQQQEAAAGIIKNQYVYQTNTMSFLSVFLNASSFDEFVSAMDYYTRVAGYQQDVISETMNAKSELESSRDQLNDEMSAAESEKQKAQSALVSAQSARQLAMQRAAEKAAAEKEAAERAANAQNGNGSGQQNQAAAPAPASGSTGAAQNNDTDNPDSDATDTEATAVIEVEDTSSDWGQDKAAFVDEWASRIDDYLSGSPLSGYGREFAEAAWDYGVNPRWSPAISCVESGKGRSCFRPHNAWGWGRSGWSSWPEAIDSHVSGLARGYGNDLTLDAAMKYCPPTYQDWYNKVRSEMNKI